VDSVLPAVAPKPANPLPDVVPNMFVTGFVASALAPVLGNELPAGLAPNVKVDGPAKENGAFVSVAAAGGGSRTGLSSMRISASFDFGGVVGIPFIDGSPITSPVLLA